MESAEHGRLTRTSMFVAVFVVVIMLGPGLLLGNRDLSPADNASAVTSDRVLRMGWTDFYGSVRTLNPHTMTMGQEYMLILPCYSFLLTYDDNGQAIGDLATKWTVSADGKSWHIWIVHSASFFDKNNPAVQVPLTVEDVMFSFWLTQNNTASISNYYLPKDPVTLAPMITSMNKINNYEMVFNLRMAFGPFMSSLTGIPIVPKYIWDGKPIGWANFAKGGNAIAPCIGSGPYYYAYDDIATIGSVGQSSNIMSPTWFGTIEYGWQPHVYQFTVKTETQSSGIANFNANNLDILIAPTPADYLASTAEYKFSSSQGFVLDMCMNQLTLADRVAYGLDGPGDYNSQLLQDPAVKYALKASVNKDAIVSQALYGGGSPADSLMPSVSPWYYHYGSNATRDTMFIPNSGDIPAARAKLMAAGWKYRSTAPYAQILPGDSDYSTYHPLAKVGGTEVLSFRYAYCDWYDFIVTEGVKIQAWAQQAGIDLVGGPATSSQMNSYWATANYDVYLWDWWMNPNVEPSLDIMELYTSMAIGGSTDVNDHNATFDEMYFKSLSITDFAARKALIDEMQRWAYENSGYWPTAYRDNQYLAHTIGPNYWTNFGDWTNHYTLAPDSDYSWLFCRLSSATPGGNPAPRITSFNLNYYTNTMTNESLTASVTDNTPLDLAYRWNWGDGTSTGWLASPTYSHQYAADGYYTAHFMVKETTSADGFISFATTKVKVIDTSNSLPVIIDATFSPGSPDSGTLVYFSSNATDSPLDTLSYTWDFGDGTTAAGRTATHRFTAGAGIYTWTLMVDDGHLGSDPRPQTFRDDIGVSLNSPPLISVGDEPSVPVGAPFLFRATASDIDVRDNLKFTWDWGDGSVSVTTTTTCNHTYKFKRDFTLTVWADDGTFITSPSHNVSDTGLVHVWATTNSAPYVNFFWGSGVWTGGGYKVLKGATVTFYANVSDPDGDVADIYFGFGDGSPAYKVTQTTPNSTVSVLHQYPTAFGGGVYFPSVTYTDTIAASATRASTDFGWYMTVWETFSIHLVTGWNFVSLPLVGYGYKAGTLGLDNGDSVAQYNTATKTYTTYIVGVPVNNFTIAPSTGYWINVPSGTRNLTLYGYLPTTTQSRTITIPAGNNWAIIGFESFNMTRRARDVALMWSVTGGITTVSTYNATAKTYTSWLKGIPTVNNFLIVPGQAYWILITTSGTLTYAP